MKKGTHREARQRSPAAYGHPSHCRAAAQRTNSLWYIGQQHGAEAAAEGETTAAAQHMLEPSSTAPTTSRGSAQSHDPVLQPHFQTHSRTPLGWGRFLPTNRQLASGCSMLRVLPCHQNRDLRQHNKRRLAAALREGAWRQQAAEQHNGDAAGEARMSQQPAARGRLELTQHQLHHYAEPSSLLADKHMHLQLGQFST